MSYIQRARIDDTEPLVDLLNTANSNWRQELIYMWQWDQFERSERDPRILYSLPLKAFQETRIGNLTLFRRKEGGQIGRFIIEADYLQYKQVVTNMEPPKGSHYEESEPERKITVAELCDFLHFQS